ncbi:ferritin-like domain-containing protein [Geotalea toluenoxydans]|uniref:ferritin-like domain-containing protein n=1 Tax=Geotalea toluenoxydans TaxID=421624 RepID=UPI0006D2B6C9|nr:ferritin-like domain-containing protein [Geotalea toluenoxydans]
MSFNPFKERGIPAEKQLRPWSELNVKPYDKNEVHPYTKARIILMNGVEVEGAIFSHQFARNLDDPELKKQLALTRRAEQQQQKAINWLSPGDETPLETTIGYEQVAVDLTAFLSANVPDPYVKQVFDFGLLEDFDHLYRYSNLLQMTEGIKSEKMLGKFTEVTPGRPTIKEHRHPFDDVRKHVDRKKADPLTNLFILTLLAGEQQTMNFYMNLGNTFKEQLGRGLYQEIAMIEEQHVTQYESLLDPTTSWIENALLHEYNECWLYWSFMEQEKDAKIKPIWELHLNMELTHLQTVAEIARKMGVEPEQLVPASLPKPLEFKSQIDYVRGILAEQVTWNACETQIGPPEKLPENSRYKATQDLLNAKGAPSEEVINMNRSKSGKEYRCELKGEHPVRELRSK